MPRRKIIPYQPYLKPLARKLRNNSTKSEIKLWRYLKGRQMLGYDFHRQKPLLNYIADFYCYELRLVVELDGWSHQQKEVMIKDHMREGDLKAVGLSVLRFKNDEVFNDIQNVLRSIEAYIVEFENLDTPL